MTKLPDWLKCLHEMELFLINWLGYLWGNPESLLISSWTILKSYFGVHYNDYNPGSDPSELSVLHLNLFTYKEDIIKLSPNVTESNITNLCSNKPALPVGNFPLGKHVFQGGSFTEAPSATVHFCYWHNVATSQSSLYTTVPKAVYLQYYNWFLTSSIFLIS